MRRLTTYVFILTGIWISPARADVTFVWETLSATFDGAPSSTLTARGAITLTDQGFANGFGSVSGGGGHMSLDGIASADFTFYTSEGFLPSVGCGADSQNYCDFTVTVDGDYLKLTSELVIERGLADDTDYLGRPGVGDLLTVSGYFMGPGPCNTGTACQVTGEFVTTPVPEPGTFALLVAGLGFLVISSGASPCLRTRSLSAIRRKYQLRQFTAFRYGRRLPVTVTAPRYR